MSTPTANTTTTTQTTVSGKTIGLIIGGIVLAALLIGFVIFIIKRRRNAAGTGLAEPPTSANGLGVLSKGSNPVLPTNIKLNAGNGNLRPPQ